MSEHDDDMTNDDTAPEAAPDAEAAAKPDTSRGARPVGKSGAKPVGKTGYWSTVSKNRLTLWIMVGGLGLYMVGSGLIGALTK